MFIGLLFVLFIITNIPEARTEALIIFVIGSVAYFVSTKPRVIPDHVKRLLLLIGIVSVGILIFIFQSPDLLSLGTVYLMFAAFTALIIMRRDS